MSIDFLNEVLLFSYDFSLVNFELEQWNKEYESFNFEFKGMTFKSRLAISLLFGVKMKLIKTDLLILVNQKIS